MLNLKRLSLTFLFVFLLANSAGGINEQEREQYAAVIVGTQGPLAARSIPIDIWIDEITSDEQVQAFAELLAEGGQQVLRRELEKVKAGRIAPAGRVGSDIAIVRMIPDGEGHVLRLVTARNMPFLELYYGGRSTDHPFGILEIKLDKDGKGEGSVIGAASLRFDEKGVLNITSYGHQPLKVVNARRYD